jgi:hypothetical protein
MNVPDRTLNAGLPRWVAPAFSGLGADVGSSWSPLLIIIRRGTLEKIIYMSVSNCESWEHYVLRWPSSLANGGTAASRTREGHVWCESGTEIVQRSKAKKTSVFVGIAAVLCKQRLTHPRPHLINTIPNNSRAQFVFRFVNGRVRVGLTTTCANGQKLVFFVVLSPAALSATHPSLVHFGLHCV